MIAPLRHFNCGWPTSETENVITLHQLKLFVSVAKNLNMTETSREFHVSQSAVSHQIKKLERELGKTLVARAQVVQLSRSTLARTGRVVELVLGVAQLALEVHAPRHRGVIRGIPPDHSELLLQGPYLMVQGALTLLEAHHRRPQPVGLCLAAPFVLHQLTRAGVRARR